MNWNGQREYVSHLIARMSDPANAAQLQAAFNAKRLAKVQSALATRPVYLPLEFVMAAAGQNAPYRDTTQSLQYDVVIVGAKTDSRNRNIILRRTETEQPIAYIGDAVNLYLTTDEIAGLSATTGGGQQGIFYWPSPMLLRAGERLTVEMFKTDTTAGTEEANLVFIGFRVFPNAYSDNLIDPSELDAIKRHIAMRPVPQVRYLKQAVSFDTALVGGVARNLATPQVGDEPLLIRGVRTTLRQSLIEVGIQGEPDWTVEPTPIWAVAGEDEMGVENYHYFPRPIFLHSENNIMVTRITNGLDGANIDAQTGNTITWLCETV